MYELTIKFETKDELLNYLTGQKAMSTIAEAGGVVADVKSKPTKPRATKKARAKVEPKIEKPVQDEIPVEEPKKEEPKENPELVRVREALDTFLNIKKSQVGGLGPLIEICNEVKSQLGIPLGTQVRNTDVDTIKNFHEQLSLTMETMLRNKNKQEKVDI